MKRHAPLNRYDIPILFLCVGFALASLAAVGSRGRTRAKEAVCRSHLRQWASVFDSFTQDHDCRFFTREAGSSNTWWIEALWSYHEDAGLLLCPSAPEFSPDPLLTHRAWRVGKYTGSYGLNEWVSDARPSEDWHTPSMWYWQTPRVWHAERVPVLADMSWAYAWPYATDMPPATEQQFPAGDRISAMQLVCVNRHEGAVNVLFMDWSVRKVGLKELWALQWSPAYNRAGPWTGAGGVTPPDWPEWMRQFKEFYEVQGDGDL